MIYAGCGNGGEIAHYDGTSWSSVPSGFGLPATTPFGSPAVPLAVWGTSPSNVWIAGSSDAVSNGSCCGKMEHSNGASWSDVPLATNAPIISEIWGSSASDVWAVSQEGIYHGTPARR